MYLFNIWRNQNHQNYMTDRLQILDAVYVAVASANETLPDDGKLEPTENVLIYGEGAKLDSLGLVSLIVSVEEEVESVLGSCPSLVEVITDPESSISSLGDIVDFIADRV